MDGYCKIAKIKEKGLEWEELHDEKHKNRHIISYHFISGKSVFAIFAADNRRKFQEYESTNGTEL